MFSATLALASGIENGQYIITHTPSHVTFLKEADKIQSSEVPSVIASTFGFSINKVRHLKHESLIQHVTD